MKTNMGKIDRILRAILGIGLISLAFVGLQTPWGWIGVVPLARLHLRPTSRGGGPG